MECTDDAAVLIGFLNTLHLPDDTDRLAGSTPDQWLADGRRDWGRSLDPAPPAGPGSKKLAQLRTLREGLRLLTLLPAEIGAEEGRLISDADQVLSSVPMRMALPPDHSAPPTLIPIGGVSSYATQITAVAKALLYSRADGSFTRIKTCARPRCRWAFYDTSKNRSRRWCSMDSCGNLMKNRDYRARRSTARNPHG
jgi:predicted RNA-binding Zn ribbon-like protein